MIVDEDEVFRSRLIFRVGNTAVRHPYSLPERGEGSAPPQVTNRDEPDLLREAEMSESCRVTDVSILESPYHITPTAQPFAPFRHAGFVGITNREHYSVVRFDKPRQSEAATNEQGSMDKPTLLTR